MRNLPDRRLLLRWMFDALGFVLLFGRHFVIHSVLRLDFWAGLFFWEDSAAYALFMAAASLYLLATSVLCWVTAAGLKRNKRWAIPVGVCTCCLLLIGFPGLTIVGGICLYLLKKTSSRPSPVAATPTPAKRTTDFWGAKRQSKAQGVAQTIVWVLALGLQARFAIYAQKAGMPAWHSGWIWFLWFSGFGLANAALHEAGHAIAAWAVGFKVRVISAGPFTFRREHSRFHFGFDPRRLFESGGYVGAVPVSDRNLRRNEIAVTAAGVIVNALTCLVFVAIFFSLPGTAWQNWWWIAALNAVIACAMTVGNLIPLGYCDGTMLFHLILGTRGGRLLLDMKGVTKMSEEADLCVGQAAFYQAIRLRKAMLERSLAFGKDNAFMIAACHQALGSAYAHVDDWPAAEFHYRKCLEFEAELAANPAFAGNAWSGLHLCAVRRHRVDAAGTAYASAVAILEKQKTVSGDQAAGSVTHSMLAQAHERNGDFESALTEIDAGLKSAPRDSNGIMLRGYLFRSRAMCLLQMHDTVSGLAAAQSAAHLFRSPEVPRSRRYLGWENIADLGYHLWRAGQTTLAIELMREGIGLLESVGAAPAAAQYRIKLAGILRQLGRTEEAWAEMPAESTLAHGLRRAFLTERAQIHLASERPGPTAMDCRELIAIWRSRPHSPEPEIASAEALLAKACLAAGDLAKAETLALHAANVLGPCRHPDAAGCLITLALAQPEFAGACTSARIREALSLIQTAVLLGPTEKGRLKEAETARIQQSPAAVPLFA